MMIVPRAIISDDILASTLDMMAVVDDIEILDKTLLHRDDDGLHFVRVELEHEVKIDVMLILMNYH